MTALPRLRRILVLTVAAIVVAVTLGWLLWPAPSGPLVIRSGTSHYDVTTTVDSARTGMTSVEVDLTDRTGRLGLPSTVDVEAVMSTMGYSGAPVSAVTVGSGRYRADRVHLMMTGQWELLVSIPGDTDHLTLPISVTG